MTRTDPLPKPLQKAMTAEYLRRRVLAYVARYLTSEVRLRQFVQRLLKRWSDSGGEVRVSDQEVQALITMCRTQGYVDDQRFAELRIARWYRAGQLQRVIYQKLRAEMLDEETINAALSTFRLSHTDQPGQLDHEAAMHFARKRGLGPYRRKDRAKWRERDIAKMGRRGFSRDTACAVIDHDGDGGESYS